MSTHAHTNLRINGGEPVNTGTYATLEEAVAKAKRQIARDPGDLTELDQGGRFFSATKVSRRAGRTTRRSAWVCTATSCQLPCVQEFGAHADHDDCDRLLTEMAPAQHVEEDPTGCSYGPEA